MKLLLNKGSLNSKLWASVISYFGRVFANLEIVPFDNPQNNHRIFQKIQSSIEARFSGVVNDIESVFDRQVSYSTSNLILNLSSIDIGELIQKYPNYEIWSFEYEGKNVSYFEKNGIGINEIVYHLETIRVDLVRYSNGKGKTIVDSAFYNPHYSAYRNFQKMLSTMPRLFVRSIKQEPFNITTPQNELQLGRTPYFQYYYSFYKSVFRKYYTVITNKLFGYYDERWTVALGMGSIQEKGVKDIMVQSMPKHEFWADPFLVNKDGSLFLFFERFPFDMKKGVISVGEVENGKVIKVRDVIEKPYHLSYPNVFEEGGDYYMIPECSANRRVEIYKCVEFPDKWELYSTAFEGESLVDTCYFRDSNNQQWLMASCSWNGVDTHNEVLNIYQIDSLKLNNIIPHANNPVIVDSRKGRNGGRIYVENCVTIRVAQDNRYGKYGHGVSLQSIDKLSLDSFKEHPINFFKGQMVDGFDGTHQMCQVEGAFVMDLRI